MGDELRFRTLLRLNGIEATEEQLSLLGEYVRLLLEWNRKINLISRRDVGNVWFSHILHSVSILMMVDIPMGCRLLDLGSGGGLPGVPLAILRGDLSVTLVDSIRKKTVALQDMISRLHLPNTTVVCSRAEDLPKAAFCSFDIVLARAVASLEDLIRWSRGLVRPHARESRQEFALPYLLCLKGGDIGGEIEHAKRKTGEERIHVKELVFRGNESLPLEEKKMVVVEL